MKRSELGFEAETVAAFSFVEEVFGLTCTERGDTRVRWESSLRFFEVFHGRQSFEIGVHFGRWIEIRVERVEQWFMLDDFLVVLGGSSLPAHGWAARERSLLARFLHELATAAQSVAAQVLNGDGREFAATSEMNARRSNAYLEDMRASRLRILAREAWHRQDFQSVVNAYSEIDQELKTIGLALSERGRLEYATRALANDRVAAETDWKRIRELLLIIPGCW